MNPNPFAWPFRAQYLAGFLVCALLLAYAIYEQFQMGVEPCPMCIFQRLAFIGMGIFFLIGGLHSPGPKGRRVYAVLVGIVRADRHRRRDQSPAHAVHAARSDDGRLRPRPEVHARAFPLTEALKKAFTGSGDCGEINWTFLGITMPGWCLIWYVILGAGAVWAGFRRRGLSCRRTEQPSRDRTPSFRPRRNDEAGNSLTLRPVRAVA